MTDKTLTRYHWECLEHILRAAHRIVTEGDYKPTVNNMRELSDLQDGFSRRLIDIRSAVYSEKKWASEGSACPRCADGHMRQCKTGDLGCLHCSDCPHHVNPMGPA